MDGRGFVMVFHSSVARLVCEFLPHSMDKNRLSTFLRLRVACRSIVKPVIKEMFDRIILLRTHRLLEVRRTVVKLMQSGIMFQLLHNGGNPRAARSLKMDSSTGIPRGMTKSYWEEGQRENKVTGWSAKGKLWL